MTISCFSRLLIISSEPISLACVSSHGYTQLFFKAMAPGLSAHLAFPWFDFRCSWCYWWQFTDSEPVQHFLFLKYLLSSLFLSFQEITLVLVLLANPLWLLPGLAQRMPTWKRAFVFSLFHSGLLNMGVGYLTFFGPPMNAISWIWVIHPHTNLHSGVSPLLVNCQNRKWTSILNLSRILFEIHKTYWKPALSTTIRE